MNESTLTSTAILKKIAPTPDAATSRRILMQFENTDTHTTEEYRVPYLTLRFECPCAACVDEITGRRTLKKETLLPEVKPTRISPVGRYGIHIEWSDGHRTGMYHFDRLYAIARETRD